MLTHRPPLGLNIAQSIARAAEQLLKGSRILQIGRQLDTKLGLKRKHDMRHRELVNVKNSCAGSHTANLALIGLTQHDIQYQIFQMLSNHGTTPRVMKRFKLRMTPPN